MAITITFECQRIACGAVDTREVDGAYEAHNPIENWLPDGWGWDHHDGINEALHCPAHRSPPTTEEIRAENLSA